MIFKKIIKLCHIIHFFEADFPANLTSLSKFYNLTINISRFKCSLETLKY